MLKAIVVREEGEKRALLARRCRKEFLAYERRLRGYLSDPDPVPQINDLMSEVETTVDRNIQEGSWPWPGPLPRPQIAAETDQLLQELSGFFSSGWAPPPAGVVPQALPAPGAGGGNA